MWQLTKQLVLRAFISRNSIGHVFIAKSQEQYEPCVIISKTKVFLILQLAYWANISPILS